MAHCEPKILATAPAVGYLRGRLEEGLWGRRG